MNKKYIPYNSPEAAERKTVTGWVSSTGRFWGEDEHMARYDGCTHQPCKICGVEIEARSYCEACRRNREIEKYNAMPREDWDGKDMLYSDAADVWFQDHDELADYCHEHEVSPEDLRLIIGEPVYAREIEPNEHYRDDLPEDGEVPTAIQEAFDALNAAIRACTQPPSWWPSKVAASDASVSIEVQP